MTERPCTSTMFAGQHTYEVEPIPIDADGYDEWERCGQAPDAPIHTDPHATVAHALHDLADTIAAARLPLPRYSLTVSACLESLDDVQVWADHYGTTIVAGGTAGDIPITVVRLPAGNRTVQVRVQGPADSRPEVERLREQVAELRAQLGQGADPELTS